MVLSSLISGTRFLHPVLNENSTTRFLLRTTGIHPLSLLMGWHWQCHQTNRASQVKIKNIKKYNINPLAQPIGEATGTETNKEMSDSQRGREREMPVILVNEGGEEGAPPSPQLCEGWLVG